MNQTDLAQLAGTSRESVSRFLAELERAGVVRSGRGRVTVLEPDEAPQLHLLRPAGGHRTLREDLELPYRWNDVDGIVRVEIGINDDPDRLRLRRVRPGLPLSAGRRSSPRRSAIGDMLGWVQLVDEERSASRGFEIDLFEPLGEVPHPFAFFGFAPTLFDSPHTDLPRLGLPRPHLPLRPGRDSCYDGRRASEVRAILGFSVGLLQTRDRIECLRPEAALGRGLERPSRRTCTGELSELKWTFAPGFFDHPLRP